jgi:hypothetical protein
LHEILDLGGDGQAQEQAPATDAAGTAAAISGAAVAPPPVPAVSPAGLTVIALLLGFAGLVVLRRRSANGCRCAMVPQ